jgi:GTP-binding protein
MTASSSPDPLVIRSLEFLGGMASVAGWRPELDLPEIAFAGRSNVGKSSLLNRLVRRKAFARVSRTPGRTREINFFKVNNRFVLADLPGYGYARISKERKADWKPLIEGYLKSPGVAGVVQLLDIRHDPTQDDMDMLDFLSGIELPTIVVLTKTDKISRAKVAERCENIMQSLGLDLDQTIPFSSATGEGRDELAHALIALIDAAGDQA